MRNYFILRCLDAAGRTIRMIMQPHANKTSAVGEAARSCPDTDHIEVVEDGQVVWQGSPKEAKAFAVT